MSQLLFDQPEPSFDLTTGLGMVDPCQDMPYISHGEILPHQDLLDGVVWDMRNIIPFYHLLKEEWNDPVHHIWSEYNTLCIHRSVVSSFRKGIIQESFR